MSQVKVKKPQWNFNLKFVAHKRPLSKAAARESHIYDFFRFLTMAISANPLY
jgi:hypothetical protein